MGYPILAQRGWLMFEFLLGLGKFDKRRIRPTKAVYLTSVLSASFAQKSSYGTRQI